MPYCTVYQVSPVYGLVLVLNSSLASMAACMATFLTSPADCVKTRMQVDPKEHPTIRKAIGRIYTVSYQISVLGFMLTSALGPRAFGLLLWIDIEDIPESGFRSNSMVGLRGHIALPSRSGSGLICRGECEQLIVHGQAIVVASIIASSIVHLISDQSTVRRKTAGVWSSAEIFDSVPPEARRQRQNAKVAPSHINVDPKHTSVGINIMSASRGAMNALRAVGASGSKCEWGVGGAGRLSSAVRDLVIFRQDMSVKSM